MKNLENKVLKEKKLGRAVTLTVTQNQMSGRIFVQFASNTPKLTLQKSFPDTYIGHTESEDFSNSIKSIKDLKKYFGIKK
jgi:hypothetical protein